MTVKEFQEQYSAYRTQDKMEALSDALKLNVIDENGKHHIVVPMQFGNEWCLMLDSAAALMKELKVDEHD